MGTLAWWITALCLVAVVVGAVLRKREFSRQRGWVLDFERRVLTPVNTDPAEPIVLDSDEHSLGCLAGPMAKDGTMTYAIELRHRRRGTIATLSQWVCRSDWKMQAVKENALSIDEAVDALALRLSLRRSGARASGARPSVMACPSDAMQ